MMDNLSYCLGCKKFVDKFYAFKEMALFTCPECGYFHSIEREKNEGWDINHYI